VAVNHLTHVGFSTNGRVRQVYRLLRVALLLAKLGGYYTYGTVWQVYS